MFFGCNDAGFFSHKIDLDWTSFSYLKTACVYIFHETIHKTVYL